MPSEPIWTPTPACIATSEILRLGSFLEPVAGRKIATGRSLGDFAVCEPEAFWSGLRDLFGIIGDKGEAPHMEGVDMIGTELAMRDMVHGQSVKNADSLANPEALDHFRDLPALALTGDG